MYLTQLFHLILLLAHYFLDRTIQIFVRIRGDYMQCNDLNRSTDLHHYEYHQTISDDTIADEDDLVEDVFSLDEQPELSLLSYRQSVLSKRQSLLSYNFSQLSRTRKAREEESVICRHKRTKPCRENQNRHTYVKLVECLVREHGLLVEIALWLPLVMMALYIALVEQTPLYRYL